MHDELHFSQNPSTYYSRSIDINVYKIIRFTPDFIEPQLRITNKGSQRRKYIHERS